MKIEQELLLLMHRKSPIDIGLTFDPGWLILKVKFIHFQLQISHKWYEVTDRANSRIAMTLEVCHWRSIGIFTVDFDPF